MRARRLLNSFVFLASSLLLLSNLSQITFASEILDSQVSTHSGFLSLVHLDYEDHEEEELLYTGDDGHEIRITEKNFSGSLSDLIPLANSNVSVDVVGYNSSDFIKNVKVVNKDTIITVGELKYVTLLCKFKDVTEIPAKDEQWFHQILGDEAPGLNHYWKEQSYGQLDLEADSLYWWTPTNATLADNTNWTFMVEECTKKANSAHNIYFPEYDGIIMMWNAVLPGAHGGVAFPMQLSLDGVSKIYKTMSVFNSSEDYNYVVSTVEHEVGHSLGLMHSRDEYPLHSDYWSMWDVMSQCRDYRRYGQPWYLAFPCVHTIAYHKNKLGWLPNNRVYTITDRVTDVVTLENLADEPSQAGTYQMVKIPVPNSLDYYTVELRARADIENTYDRNLPEYGGVIIHRVRVSSNGFEMAYIQDTNNDGNSSVNDQSAIFTVGERFNFPNTNYYVTINSQTHDTSEITLHRVANIKLDRKTVNDVNTWGNFTRAGQSFSPKRDGILKSIFICGGGVVTDPSKTYLRLGDGMQEYIYATAVEIVNTNNACSQGIYRTWTEIKFPVTSITRLQKYTLDVALLNNNISMKVVDSSPNCNENSDYKGGIFYGWDHTGTYTMPCYDAMLNVYMTYTSN